MASASLERGSCLLARLAPRKPIPLELNRLWPDHQCSVSDIIDICGPDGSGKTQLLMSCIASALMSDHTGTVVLYDIQRHVNIDRIKVMLVGSGCDDPGRALCRLLVATPSSSIQLLAGIEALGMQLASAPLMLAIDSLFSQYWTDRALESAGGAPRTDTLYNQLASRLAVLARTKRVLVVCTRRNAKVGGVGGAGTQWAHTVSRQVHMNRSADVFVARANANESTSSVEKKIVIDDSGMHWI